MGNLATEGAQKGGCQRQPQGSGELRDGGALAQPPPSEMASPDRGAPGIITHWRNPLTLSTGLAPRLGCRPESRTPSPLWTDAGGWGAWLRKEEIPIKSYELIDKTRPMNTLLLGPLFTPSHLVGALSLSSQQFTVTPALASPLISPYTVNCPVGQGLVLPSSNTLILLCISFQ